MSTRRSFLAALAGLVPAAWLGGKALAIETKGPQIGDPHPGTITPAYWNRHLSDYRLLLNGEDITTTCYQCNIAGGWADCYVMDEKGNVAANDRIWFSDGKINGSWEPRKHRRFGELRIVRKGSYVTEYQDKKFVTVWKSA